MLARVTEPDMDFLAKAVAAPPSETTDRILTAIRWFNVVNAASSDEAMAVIALAIAFESMLCLPEGDRKTEPLAEAVSLLLGRVPRLDNWARQFYRARSAIVHEGRAQHLHFFPSDGRQPAPDSPRYRPLLSYGRQIFRLCVGVLLTGADLAERAELQDAFVTNQERFEAICKALDDQAESAATRLARVAPLVRAADRSRFVSETGLRIESLLGAARLSAAALLEADPAIEAGLRKTLEQLASAKRSADHYEELDALSKVKDVCKTVPSEDEVAGTARYLIELVWHYTFMHYYWLRQQRTPSSDPDQV